MNLGSIPSLAANPHKELREEFFVLRLLSVRLGVGVYVWALYNDLMTTVSTNKYLFAGILLTLPFAVLNTLAITGSPVIKFLRSENFFFGNEQLFIFILLLLVFVGGVITLFPMIKNRRASIPNAIIGVFFIVFSLMAGYGLGVDVYHCDILKIPNCD